MLGILSPKLSLYGGTLTMEKDMARHEDDEICGEISAHTQSKDRINFLSKLGLYPSVFIAGWMIGLHLYKHCCDIKRVYFQYGLWQALVSAMSALPLEAIGITLCVCIFTIVLPRLWRMIRR